MMVIRHLYIIMAGLNGKDFDLSIANDLSADAFFFAAGMNGSTLTRPELLHSERELHMVCLVRFLLAIVSLSPIFPPLFFSEQP